MIRSSAGRMIWDGWNHGENGTGLIWLSAGMRHVWLATGRQLGHRRLILRQDSGGVAVLDMEDYLNVLPVGGVWRDGGVRYVTNKAEVVGAYALVAESGPVVCGAS